MDVWSEQEVKPIPLKFELTPVVNLFTSDNLDKRLNISSARILRWYVPRFLTFTHPSGCLSNDCSSSFVSSSNVYVLFPRRFLPLYLKYCKVFDFDCTLETGCGFDDSCGFEENCVRDRQAKKGHRCQGEEVGEVEGGREEERRQEIGVRYMLYTYNMSRPHFSATSWADVPNWPQLPTVRSGGGGDVNQIMRRISEPESPNISWFFEKDADQVSGGGRGQEREGD